MTKHVTKPAPARARSWRQWVGRRQCREREQQTGRDQVGRLGQEVVAASRRRRHSYPPFPAARAAAPVFSHGARAPPMRWPGRPRMPLAAPCNCRPAAGQLGVWRRPRGSVPGPGVTCSGGMQRGGATQAAALTCHDLQQCRQIAEPKVPVSLASFYAFTAVSHTNGALDKRELAGSPGRPGTWGHAAGKKLPPCV